MQSSRECTRPSSPSVPPPDLDNFDWPGVVVGGYHAWSDTSLPHVHDAECDSISKPKTHVSGKKQEKVDAGIAPWLDAEHGGTHNASGSASASTSNSVSPSGYSQPVRTLSSSTSSPHLPAVRSSSKSTSTSSFNSGPFGRSRHASNSGKSGISTPSMRPSPPGEPATAGKVASASNNASPHPVAPIEEKRKKFLGRLGISTKRRPATVQTVEDATPSSNPRLAPAAAQRKSTQHSTDLKSQHHSHLTSHLPKGVVPPHLALPHLTSFMPIEQRQKEAPSLEDPRKVRKSSKKSTWSDNSSEEAMKSVSGSRSSQLFTLDTNLDHMEGIVSRDWDDASGSIHSGSVVGLWPEGGGSVSSIGSSSVGSRSGTLPQHHTTFTNPFAPASNQASRNPSNSSSSIKGAPVFTTSLPRRPSQLRSMVTPSDELGTNPFDQLASNKTPQFSPSTEFRNPFEMTEVDLTRGSLDPVTSPLSMPGGSKSSDGQPDFMGSRQANVAPPIRSQFQAWTAPESWGVEGDQEDESSDDEEVADAPTMMDSAAGPSSLNVVGGGPRLDGTRTGSKGDNQRGSQYTVDSSDGVLGKDTLRASSNGSIAVPGGIGGPSTRPIASRGSQGGKQSMTNAFGRPSTGSTITGGIGEISSRPATTSGLSKMTSGGSLGSTAFIRIYISDGSYKVLAVALTATTMEIIYHISAKLLISKGGHRLYIRERGNDRPLDAREKPALIQRRRLIQAGYQGIDGLDELGKDDVSMLCKFVFRLPQLPGIESADENSFDSSFEYVDISGRDLQVFPIFLHRHAHTIVLLNLSKNPLQELPSDFIQACTTLRELKMSHMSLKRIPQSIRQSSSLTRLDLSCNRIADLDQGGFNDIPGLLSLRVQNNRLSVLPAYFGQLRTLKYLNLSNNSFEAFPSIVCEIRSLVDLDISFNAISYLPPEVGKLVNLERFLIVGNLVTSIPSSFARLENLREFDCRRNRIVDFEYAYALPKLEVLRAERNDVNVFGARFGPKMSDVNLSYNSITKFSLSSRSPDTAFGLTNLDLSFAKLSSIDDEAMAHLVSLVVLKLDGNKFTSLPDSIANLSLLREIHCADNALTVLPDGISQLQKLEIINVHNNNLGQIPPGIWYCSSLVTLNASSNLLETFPDPPEEATQVKRDFSNEDGDENDSPFPLGARLRQLYLCDNQLTDDVFHPVSLLTSLRTLNLSFNEILEIPAWTLRKNRSLVALYLSGNKLTSLPAEDLENLMSLMVFHVNGNKLQSLPAELSDMRRLTVLDVGSNVLKYNIDNWQFDWNWAKNVELRYLNLSGNKRFEIKPSADRSHLNEYFGQGNSRNEFAASFAPLVNIRTLGLMDVTVRIIPPDETEDRRVRSTVSEVNNMSYGFSDTLGKYEHLLLNDLVVPSFREKDNEALFGIFGLSHATNPGLVSRIPYLISEWFQKTFSNQLSKLKEGEGVADALRRTFLLLNKTCYEALTSESMTGRKGSQASAGATMNSGAQNGPSSLNAAVLRTGASAVVAYVVDKVLYVANAGACQAVVSKKGTAEALSSKHEPFERSEAARIRSAEGWITAKGLLNEELDVSRGFGFYHLIPAVNSCPDVRSYTLSDSDEFVILANKGLWDCMTYQTAVDIARTEKDDSMMAAQKLRDFALSYGMDGAIMVMIISVGDLFNTRMLAKKAAFDSSTLTEGYYPKRALRKGKIDHVGDRTLARLDREIPPPTGFVAIVFTDIKNSTALWETNQGMQTAIKMHNSLLRRQLRSIGGYEVKTEGDAFMVSFPTVASAVLWSFTCQLMLLQEDWPSEILECEDGKEVFDEDGQIIYRGLWVRMGIHWGNPVCEADPITKRMDYFGPMVNKASRVSSVADGGQIMVSQGVVQEMKALFESLDAPQTDDAMDGEVEEKFGPHAAQLRKLGFGVSFVGEKKLKGLENHEKLSLVYPAALSGRLASVANQDNVKTGQIFEPKQGLLNVDCVRYLSFLCTRLEVLSSTGVPFAHTSQLPKNTPRRIPTTSTLVNPQITLDMTDEELFAIVNSLTARIENSLSTMYLKQLDGFSTVLAALSQGLAMDSRLLVHAMGLFSNLMNPAESSSLP
ncbi:adenylate cyclase [Phaffia rhodozyma]|uniref:Adenylate cyclase n=1 Tax=Phaffia rhodozyma TaxID=264483 RepID=A0A0F7SR48_PHARH|nr:adenylate cyclase [Phaffia rhodozyma]